MKKIIALMVVMIMALGMCACSITVNNPEDTVEDFLKALKSGDQEQLMLYIDNNDINTLLNNTMDEETSKEIYNNLMKNLSWEIVSVETNEDNTSAVVTVKISNADFSNTLKKYKKAAVDYMMFNLYDDEVTKKVMKAKCQELFVQQIKTDAAADKEPVTVEVKVELTKNDNYSWDMKVTKQLTKAALGGLKWPAN